MQASSFDDPIKGTNLQEPQPSFCPKVYSFLPMFLLEKSSITGYPRQGLNHGFHQLLGGRGGIWQVWPGHGTTVFQTTGNMFWAILGIILLTNHIKPSFGRTWKLGKTHINQTGNLIYIYKPNQTVYIYIYRYWMKLMFGVPFVFFVRAELLMLKRWELRGR